MNNLILPKPKLSTRRSLAGVLGLLLALGLLLVLAFPFPALAFPPIPDAFYGTVSVNGSPAAVGTMIEVRYGTDPITHAGGTIVASASKTLVTVGQYGYGSDALLVSWEGAPDGTLIDFFVTPPGAGCPKTYAATATFVSGGSVPGVPENLNLSVTGVVCAYILTYSAGPNGTISGTSPQFVVPNGNGSAVTAVPNTGYHFVNWSDSSTANPRQDTNVTANISVTANFAINTYTLTYTPGANGTISGVSPQTVNYGGSGSAVTAVPNAGYRFVNWSDSSTANPRQDTNVTANISVTANFAVNNVTLTYTAGANGTISGVSPQTFAYGGNGSAVTAIPNAGYHFVNWSDASTANPRQDTNVTANISVTANFAINTYTLTYTPGANGTISGVSPQTVNHGGSGSAVTAVPNTGYRFMNWSDGPTDNPRQDTNVTANISVTANFEVDLPCPAGAILSIPLKEGWNTFSIPIKPDASMDTWSEFIAVNSLNVEVVYGYNAVAQLWVQINTQNGDDLVVLNGYYVKMLSAGTACVIPSANQSAQPVKSLSVGLNLVGVASLINVDVVSLLTTVSGYDLVHNPPVNGAGNWVNNIYIKGASPIPTAKVGLAYWVNMQNPGNMVGFTSTPLP